MGAIPGMPSSGSAVGGLSSWDAPASNALSSTAGLPAANTSWNLPPAPTPSADMSAGLPSTSSLFGNGLFGGFTSQSRASDNAAVGGRHVSQTSIGSVGSGRDIDLSRDVSGTNVSGSNSLNNDNLDIGSLVDDDVDLLDNAALDGLLGAIDGL